MGIKDEVSLYMQETIPGVPIPPPLPLPLLGNCGAFAHLVSPGGGA